MTCQDVSFEHHDGELPCKKCGSECLVVVEAPDDPESEVWLCPHCGERR